MDQELFRLIFWLIIISIWIIGGLLKKEVSKLPKEKLPFRKHFPELEEFFKTLEPKVVKPVAKKPKVLEKPKLEKPPPPKKEEAPVVSLAQEKEKEFLISADKLQEGIILSEILGPPKAFIRGVRAKIKTHI